MVNVARGQGAGEGAQLIKVSRPVSIMKKPILGPAKLRESWSQFFEGQGIKLTPKHGFLVKTAQGTRPVRTAELNEEVGAFVGKYSIRRRIYSVELVAKANGRTIGAGGARPFPSRALRTPGPASRPSTSVPARTSGAVAGPSVTVKVEGGEGPPHIKIEPGSSGTGGSGENAVSFNAPPVDNEEEAEPPRDASNARMQCVRDDDNVSLITSVSVQNRELRRLGIRVEDVKSYAERRMRTFGNDFLLKVRKEQENLRGDSQQLEKKMQEEPLSTYMMQQLFKL